MARIISLNVAGYRVGESHPRAKHSDELVDTIREYHEDKGRSYRWIANRLNLSYRYVEKVCIYAIRAQVADRYVRVE